MTNAASFFEASSRSPLVRVVGVAFLVLLLQIPIFLIANTIEERRSTRQSAFNELAATWGSPQELTGPILTVTATEHRVQNYAATEVAVVHSFLPRALRVTGRAAVEVRRRGIFDVPLYVATLRVEGSFELPDERLPAGAALDWSSAAISVGVSDPRAIRSASPLTIGERKIAFEPGPASSSVLVSGLHAMTPRLIAQSRSVPFAFDLVLGGSGRFSVAPLGDETSVQLESSWPHPSFDGSSLPVERSVGKGGFSARWQALHLGRNFPSTWAGRAVDQPRLAASAFGVSLLSPVDTYRTNERAVKYQLLFIGLTFLAFWLFELLMSLRVHPIQYLLVGLSLCLFFLLLLSLSEQIGFHKAYLAAATGVVALVGTYVRSVLKSAKRALAIAALLTGLYGFLFVLLQLQDLSLLVGSLALFCVLAAVMWFTRRVDWYGATQTPTEPHST